MESSKEDSCDEEDRKKINAQMSLVAEAAADCTATPEGVLLRNCFLPQIPWLEKRGSITDFSKSKIAEIIGRQKDGALKKQELFLALSQTMPLYLPAW